MARRKRSIKKTHVMEDGTVMPGRTHEEYLRSLKRKEAAAVKKKGGTKKGPKPGY